MITLRFNGEIADRFGKEYTFHVDTIQKALKMMEVNFKGFFNYLKDSDQRIAGYEVIKNATPLTETSDEFYIQSDTAVVTITPVAIGAGANARIITGVVLVIVGACMMWAGGSGSLLAAQGMSVLMGGAALAIGGIAEKLSATKLNNAADDEADTPESYIFSGPTNTSRQGTAIFVGYGKHLVGSIVISASITTSDVPV